MDLLTLRKANDFTTETVIGMGALKGASAQIKSITSTPSGDKITFLWVDKNDVEHTDTLTVKDAYGIWLELGNTGTKQDFIDSLKGKSSYELAVKNGFVGTEQEYLESLKAKLNGMHTVELTEGDGIKLEVDEEHQTIEISATGSAEFPEGGDKGQVLGKLSNADDDVGWLDPGEPEYPKGGTKGQVLAKASNEDNDVEWVDRADGDVPDGGSKDQVLGKKSGDDGDYDWIDQKQELPDGGTTGQVLSKKSNDDADVEWIDAPSGIPAGGSTGQVLVKKSDDDDDVEWSDVQAGVPKGGTTGQVLAKRSDDNGDVGWIDQSIPSGGIHTVAVATGDYERLPEDQKMSDTLFVFSDYNGEGGSGLRYHGIDVSRESVSVTTVFPVALISVSSSLFEVGDPVVASIAGHTVNGEVGDDFTALITLPALGSWSFSTTSSKTSDTFSNVVSITEIKQYEVWLGPSIYGIQREVSTASVYWQRTDDAVGLEQPTASVGTVAGHSVFDDFYPWSEMKRENINGDIMVKIPEFWYQRSVDGDNVEHIRITDRPVTGFDKHPGSGRYVGAYKTSSNNRSVSGVAPQTNQTRATMRTNARAKGDGWGIIDAVSNSAIQMLYLVEYANNDSQTCIGRGYCDGNTKNINTGSCDSVPGLTGRPAGTDGKVDVVYRGIEGVWGNMWELVDGVNWNNGEYYVCTDPSKYADDTATNYTKLNYTGATNWSYSYITEEGCDPSVSWAMLPKAAGSGSGSTYQCDGCWSSTAWRVCLRGGSWAYGSGDGLFAVVLDAASSGTYSSHGSRLLYVPS